LEQEIEVNATAFLFHPLHKKACDHFPDFDPNLQTSRSGEMEI
jgi:hypothetical protein